MAHNKPDSVCQCPLQEKFPCIHENAFEWIVPTIFISSFLLSQNPHSISVVLGVISNYLTDWLKGIPSNKEVKLDIIEETRTGKYK